MEEEEFVINITNETAWIKQMDRKSMHQILSGRVPGCHPTLRIRDGKELYHPKLGEFLMMRMQNGNFAGYNTEQEAIEKAKALKQEQYEFYIEEIFYIEKIKS